MTTVLDSFVIELGLDPKNFSKGQKEILAGFGNAKRDVVATGRVIEETGKRTAESISKITREMLALFAVITGARSLKDFTAQLVTTNAELGRLGRNLNISPQTLSAWGAAAERLGGTADATIASFERVSKSLYDLQRNAQLLPKEFSQLQALTGVKIDPYHGVDKFMRNTAAALKEMAAIDPAQAHFLAQGLGIDDATANAMIKYGDGIGAYIANLKRLSPSDASIKASADLQENWEALAQTITSLANELLPELNKILTPVLQSMAKWVDANRDWVSSAITDKVGDLVDYMKQIDWNEVGKGLDNFAQGAKSAADAVGGLSNALQILFGIWAGGKAANLLFGGAAGGGAATAGGGSLGIIGLLGRVAPFLSMLLLSGDTPKGAGEDPRMDQWTKEWWHMKGWDRSGPTTRGRYRSGDGGRASSLDSFLNLGPAEQNIGTGHAISEMLRGMDKYGSTKVDGRPVSKGNPMPVVIQQGDSGGGGGFWSNLLGSVADAMTSGGGGLLGLAGSLAGSGAANDAGGGGGATDVTGSQDATGVKYGKKVTGAQRMMDRLIKVHGWTPAAAAIAAAQSSAESSFNPNALNRNDAGPGLHSRGLFQWNRGRLSAMQKFVGSDWATDFDGQVDFFAKEAEGMLPKWKYEKDLSNAGIIGKRFEGYKGPIQGARAKNAARFLSQYDPALGVVETPPPVAGAGPVLSSVSNDHRVTTSDSSVRLNIGKMDIHDGSGSARVISKNIAHELQKMMKRGTDASSANFGPA